MKKYVWVLCTVILLCSCSSKKYQSTAKEVLNECLIVAQDSESMCNLIAKTWSNAIFDDVDYYGDYCSDFNRALQQMRSVKSDEIELLSTSRALLIEKVGKMKPPKSYIMMHNDLMELVTLTSSFSRLATDPSGSLQSFRNNFQEMEEEILRKTEAFEIKYASELKR